MRLFRDCILQGQHDLLPLRLASFRAYASNKPLPICLQGSIPGSWLAITWAGFAPASLCGIAKPQRALNPEFERSLIVERTQAGLKAAKRRGTKLGRRPSLSDNQLKHARDLLGKGESPATVAKLLNVCRATLYNSLKRP
jgi:hypothetical protein